MRARTIQVDNGHVLLAQPVHGRVMVHVERAQSPQGGLEVIVFAAHLLRRAVAARAPPHDALHQYRVVAVQVQRQLGRAAERDEVVRVLDRAREAVEEHALARVVLHALLHERHDNGAGHELAAAHNVAHGPPEGRVERHFLPQQVARRQMHHVAFLRQALGQQALAGARSAHDENDARGIVTEEQVGVLQEFVQVNETVPIGIGHREELGNGVVGGDFPNALQERTNVVAIETRHAVVLLGVLRKEVGDCFLVPNAMGHGAALLLMLR